MVDITLVLPECSDDKISADLRYLTEILMRQGAETTGGFLGGTFGYGADFENDVFMMHPFCWCEENDCPWCLPCFCEIEKRGDEWTTTKECQNCADDNQRAPNFLHKESGTKVHWYKYIGRGMEVDLHGDWMTLFDECIQSITTPEKEG